jgi:dihydrofolate reductase
LISNRPPREEERQMRRIVVSMWTTLDGFVAGPEDEMPWLALDERMMEYEISLVSDAEALLLGRVTHGDFAGEWPRVARDESADPATRAYAQRVDEMPKIVVSRSRSTPPWANSLVESVDEDTVMSLKRDGDGDLVVYGSLSVIGALRAIDMIDEYHLLMHPVTIGQGGSDKKTSFLMTDPTASVAMPEPSRPRPTASWPGIRRTCSASSAPPARPRCGATGPPPPPSSGASSTRIPARWPATSPSTGSTCRVSPRCAPKPPRPREAGERDRLKPGILRRRRVLRETGNLYSTEMRRCALHHT